MIMTVANVLTTSRIMLTPFIVRCLVYEQWSCAAILFAIAALTDLFDGVVARWLAQETTLGACLDPIADKLLIVGCYGTLLYTSGTHIGIPLWLTILVMVREALLIMGGLCLGARSLQKCHPRKLVFIRPTLCGKWTTVGHCVILSMIYTTKAGLWCIQVYVIQGIALITGVLMCVSGMQYSMMWWRIMRSV